ncbi:MAG: hypothetical protein AAFU60_04875, partial [Bacteroidota bacterium]
PLTVRNQVIFFLSFCLFLPIFSFAQGPADLIQSFENGMVNWSQGFIEAEGFTVINYEKYPNPKQAEALAQRGAVVVAKANLLEITQGVRIRRETVVKDLMTESDMITARVEGVVRGAQKYGEAIVADGVVTVMVRMPIYGMNSLASSTQAALPNLEANSGYKAKDSEAPTPEEIEAATIEVYRSFATEAGESPQLFLEKPTDGTKVQPILLPKLALDFGPYPIIPSLFPILVSDSGDVLVDYAQLSGQAGLNPQAFWQLSPEQIKELQVKKNLQVLQASQKEPGVITVELDDDQVAEPAWQTLLKVSGVYYPVWTGQ